MFEPTQCLPDATTRRLPPSPSRWVPIALLVSLTLGAGRGLAIPPRGWDPTGKPARITGHLCRGSGDEGGTGYGVWVDVQSRSRRYVTLELAGAAPAPLSCALDYAHPYDVAPDYFSEAARVEVSGTFLSGNSVEVDRFERACRASPAAPSRRAGADVEALAAALAEAAARPEDDAQARSTDARSMTRLLRRGLAERLSRILSEVR